MNNILERDTYFNQIKSLIDKDLIKIITGIRRSGKSTILKMVGDYLENLYGSDFIIYIDFSDLKNEYLLEYRKLYEYINTKTNTNNKYYLLFDEIQDVYLWEKAVNSFYNSNKFDIYLTGSNSKLLSSELSTLLTGRYIEIQVFPFSFKEYTMYFDKIDSYKLFDKYLRYGGFPGLLDLKENDYNNYIESLILSILEKDIKNRHIIDNNLVFNKILTYISKNIGKQTSIKKISDSLISSSINASQNTISTYLSYYMEAFIFKYVNRFDVRGSEILNTLGKYYLIDLGLRIPIISNEYQDIGFAYENIIYLELLRRGYKVYVGKLYQNEIDFIAEKYSSKLYIQVAYQIDDSDTFQREVVPLLKIKDNYEKLLIADTRVEEKDYFGIKIIDIRKWLLNE